MPVREAATLSEPILIADVPARSSEALLAGDATDADLLDVLDKRSRLTPMQDRARTTLIIGDIVRTPWIDRGVVLGPGRGRNTLLVGWVEDGARCYGTAFAAESTKAAR